MTDTSKMTELNFVDVAERRFRLIRFIVVVTGVLLSIGAFVLLINGGTGLVPVSFVAAGAAIAIITFLSLAYTRYALWNIALTVVTVSLALGATWAVWRDYVNFREMITVSTTEVAAARAELERLSRPADAKAPEAADLWATLPPLDILRNQPAGFGSASPASPTYYLFGENQRQRLSEGNIALYRESLRQVFGPLVLDQVEADLARSIELGRDPFNPLKAYLMLGLMGPMDTVFFEEWITALWVEQIGSVVRRSDLDAHLRAFLDIPRKQVAVNVKLIEAAQAAAARLPISERIYDRLRLEAEVAGYAPWLVAERAGPDAALVFETANGAPLSDLRVPGFYTREGFVNGIVRRLPAVLGEAEKDVWVLGHGSLAPEETATIFEDVLSLYRADFIAAWERTLGNLKIRPVTSDPPTYPAMRALSSAFASPLDLLFESVAQETNLNDGTIWQAPESEPTQVGERITAYFAEIRNFVLGQAAQAEAPIAVLLNQLSAVNDILVESRLAANANAQTGARMRADLSRLAAINTQSPSLIAAMIDDVVKELDGLAAETTRSRLSQALAQEVTGQCEALIAKRFPFDPNAEDEVPLLAFQQMFGPGGTLDSFFQQNLITLVDLTGQNWRWRDTAPGLSDSALRQFQRAAEIRDTYFATGQVGIQFTITPDALSPNVSAVTLQADGQELTYAFGPRVPTRMTWPGPGAGLLLVSFTPAQANDADVTQEGTWAIIRSVQNNLRFSSNSLARVIFGRDPTLATFLVRTETYLNPFTLQALRDFRCPSDI